MSSPHSHQNPSRCSARNEQHGYGDESEAVTRGALPRVYGLGAFSFERLSVHASIEFRSPRESYANASESFNKVRSPSER